MIGSAFDDYVITDKLDRRHNNQYYKVRCKKCGHEKECSLNNLKQQDNHHSHFNCKGDYYAAFVGRKFGDYTCNKIEHDPTSKAFMATMKCAVCGHEIKMHASNISNKSHNAFTCKKDYHNSLIGKRFGDLVIVGVSEKYNRSAIYYRCQCAKCGIESLEEMSSLKRNIAHGAHCFKLIPDDEYKQTIVRRFNLMDQRCNNPENKQYRHYGGRGIKLLYEHSVDLYLDFIDELRKHAQKYGLSNSTFDRIDVDGNYEKHNLRIANQTIQSTNTTRKRLFIIENSGQRILSDNAMECGRLLGLNGHSIGNVVRGSSKSSGGWKLYRVLKQCENIDDVVNNEGVTTKLIVS